MQNLLAVEKQYKYIYIYIYIYSVLWVCVALSYPAWVAILSSVACPALQSFSILSHKRHDFREKLSNIKCVCWFFLQIMSEIFLTQTRTESDVIRTVHRSLSEVPLLLSDFHETWILLIKFRKNTQIPNFMKIDPVGAELFLTDKVTGRQNGKLIIAFHYFANAPKNRTVCRLG